MKYIKINSMDIFTFGKYKEYRVDDVIEFNPKYVRWAEENVSGFSLTKSNIVILVFSGNTKVDVKTR